MKKYIFLGLILATYSLYSHTTKQLKIPENQKFIENSFLDTIIPSNYKNLQNPLKYDDESKSIGKRLYSLHCKSCHGLKGLGDGPKAKGLNVPIISFSSADFQSQTDGELFFKLKYGNDKMPPYEKIISEEDRWILINYLRTFKK